MQASQCSFLNILGPYKDLIEKKIETCIPLLGPKTALRDACEYALLNGGKRFRPALVFIIAKAIGNGADVSHAAAGIEFFHTASLIVDDLPCMDNDDQRRSKPSTHRVFDESTALLASYALISAGYGCLVQNGSVLKESGLPFASQSDHLCLLALENAAYNTGLSGTTGGQFLDLSPPNLSLSLVQEIIHKKTVSLFEISFIWGWLFGGGDLTLVDLVKKSAGHFGIAFQIADDLDDMEQDAAHEHPINIANIMGKQEAKAMFYKEIELFNLTLDQLNLRESDLCSLCQLLVSMVENKP